MGGAERGGVSSVRMSDLSLVLLLQALGHDVAPSRGLSFLGRATMPEEAQRELMRVSFCFCRHRAPSSALTGRLGESLSLPPPTAPTPPTPLPREGFARGGPGAAFPSGARRVRGWLDGS